MKGWLNSLQTKWQAWKRRNLTLAQDCEGAADIELENMVRQFTRDERWRFVEALIVRERLRLLDTLVFAKGDDVLTIQGKIKSLNWLLQLSLKK